MTRHRRKKKAVRPTEVGLTAVKLVDWTIRAAWMLYVLVHD